MFDHLIPPVATEYERNRLKSILWGFQVVTAIAIIISLPFIPVKTYYWTAAVSLIYIAMTVWLISRDRLEFVRVSGPVMMVLVTTHVTLTGGLPHEIGINLYLIAIFAAAVVWGTSGSVIICLASINGYALIHETGIHADGHSHLLIFSILCIGCTAFIAVFTAITRQESRKVQEASEQLESLHASYQKIIELNDEVVYVRNLDENRYEYMGEGCLRMIGIASGDLTPDKFDEIVCREPENTEALLTDREEMFTAEFKITLDDGSERWLFNRAVQVLNPETGVKRSIGIAQDVTERKEQEAELKRYQQELESLVNERTAELISAKEAAEAASLEKSRFLSSMSHELRTPLNGILGYSQILDSEVHGKLNEKQHDFLKKIESSGNDLLYHISDLLDVSRIEAGKLRLEQVPVPLRDFTEGVVQPLRTLAVENDVRLLMTFDPKTPEQILTDPERLKQILINLLTNAIKFSAREDGYGRVNLTVQEVADGNVSFVVSDDGLGIDPEYQKVMFEPFSQADRSVNRQYGGAGLGLYIVKQLVDLLQGEISVVSKPERGSCFTVLLPSEVSELEHTDEDIDGVTILALISGVLQTSGADYLVSRGVHTEFLSSEEELMNRLQQVEGKYVVGLSLETRAEIEEVMQRVLVRFPGSPVIIGASDPMEWVDFQQPNCEIIQRYPMLISEMITAIASVTSQSPG